MPVRISAMPSAGAVTGTELVPVVQGGVTAKASAVALVGGVIPTGSYVTTTTAQTVGGTKTFTGGVIVKADAIYDIRAYPGYDPIGADNSAAIAAANAAAVLTGAGKVLFFPPGVTMGILSATSGMTYRGAGATVSTLKLPAAKNASVVDGLSCVNTRLCDLTVDGNAAAQTANGSGVVFSLGERVTVERVVIQSTRQFGAQFFKGTRLVVRACEVRSIGLAGGPSELRTGIRADGATYVTVTENQVTGTLDHGILVTGCTHSVIAGNQLSVIANIGVALGAGNGRHTLVHGNEISGCGNNGIDTGTETDVVVTSNVISDVLDGIDADLSTLGVRTAANLVVSGNRISGCGRYGVIVGGADAFAAHGVVISGNGITTVQQHGIIVASVWDSVVSDNVVRDASRQVTGFGGIRLTPNTVGCQNNVITNNRVYDDGAVQTSGIDKGASPNNYNIYATNSLRGCAAAFAGTAGANDVVEHNVT